MLRSSDLGEFDYVLACQILFFLDQPTLERVLSQIPVGALIHLASLALTLLIPILSLDPKLGSTNIETEW